MKTSQILAVLGLSAIAAAQVLPPSPTASIGCEPHRDHWHCEGPRETGAVAASSASVSLAPSPIESFGCEPHGDHWHCEGARATTAAAGTALTTSVAAVTTTAAEDHDHSAGTASLPPSPTGRGACSPHGDHWHCEGAASTAAGAGTTIPAASTGAAATSTSNGTSPSTTAVPAGAARAGFGAAAIAAALMAL